MKPEDLNPPFPRTDQHRIIHDRVWYHPEESRHPDLIFPGWEHPSLFGNDRPVVVEFCSGNGAWIAKKAAENPHLNWVAVEMKFDRVRKIWSKIKNGHLDNLIVIWGEAHATVEKYFPDNSISDAYMNFPDPWPKNRHAKNRLMRTEFADQLSRILKEGKSFTFVTDDAPYSKWTIQVMREHRDFVSFYPEPFFTTDASDYGASYFDSLWREQGRVIRYHKFYKRILQAV